MKIALIYITTFIFFTLSLGVNIVFADSGGGLVLSPNIGLNTNDIILIALPNTNSDFAFLTLYSFSTNSSGMPSGCSEVYLIPFNLHYNGGNLPESIAALTNGYACNTVGTYRIMVGHQNNKWGYCVNYPNTLENCMASGAIDGYSDYTINPPEPKFISIDIRPKNELNPINISSRGRIVVALLASDDFNPTTEVDTDSLTFGQSGDEKSLEYCNKKEDVDGDGLLDLICHFKTELTNFVTDDTEGILKGATTDGLSIKGVDSVRITPKTNLLQTISGWLGTISLDF